MRLKGKVVKWFDDKGYGFISTGDAGDKVFAHITAFPVGAERPNFAEEVTYELMKDAKNRMKAVKRPILSCHPITMISTCSGPIDLAIWVVTDCRVPFSERRRWLPLGSQRIRLPVVRRLRKCRCRR